MIADSLNVRLRLKNPFQFTAMAIAIATAGNTYAEIVAIPAAHLGDRKTLRAQIFVPESTSIKPRAAAIMLHGCGGIGVNGVLNARHMMWKDWLLERGFIVVFPESFSSRGFDQICTQKFSDRTLKQADRVEDVAATRRWLAARSGIDASKLVIWGWSHGGGTVLASIALRTETRAGKSAPDDMKFAQAISFYPGCSIYANSTQTYRLTSPLTLLIGDADDWTPAAPCKTWIERLQSDKQIAKLITFEGAFHDFDNPGGKLRVRKDVPNGVKPGEGVTVGPDPKARQAAMQRIDAMLKDAGLLVISSGGADQRKGVAAPERITADALHPRPGVSAPSLSQ
jgi:dienelactone hydrolase